MVKEVGGIAKKLDSKAGVAPNVEIGEEALTGTSLTIAGGAFGADDASNFEEMNGSGGG